MSNGGPHLSCARRFVITAAGGRAIADGVVFTGHDQIVLCPRDTGVIEIHYGDVLLLHPLVGHVEWIDAERPQLCREGTNPHG